MNFNSRSILVPLIVGSICFWLAGCGTGEKTVSTPNSVTPSTYNLTGMVYDYSASLLADQPLAGVPPIPSITVTTVGLTPMITATAEGSDQFEFQGIPEYSTFSIHLSSSPQTTYADTYSASVFLNSSVNINSTPFALFTPSALLYLGNNSPVIGPGNGVIYGNVLSSAGNIGGAVVTATDVSNGATYPVLYYNTTTSTFSSGTTSTDAVNSSFAIINVPEGHVVNATASLSGYTFNTLNFKIYKNAVSQGTISGTLAP